MEFMAVHSSVPRNPGTLQHDKHKSSKVAVSPTSGNDNPVWKRERKKHILEAASISVSLEETETERHSILRIPNQTFSLSVSLLLLCFDCHIFIAWQFSFGKALELSLQTYMPEMPGVKYCPLISMNSST